MTADNRPISPGDPRWFNLTTPDEQIPSWTSIEGEVNTHPRRRANSHPLSGLLKATGNRLKRMLIGNHQYF